MPYEFMIRGSSYAKLGAWKTPTQTVGGRSTGGLKKVPRRSCKIISYNAGRQCQSRTFQVLNQLLHFSLLRLTYLIDRSLYIGECVVAQPLLGGPHHPFVEGQVKIGDLSVVHANCVLDVSLHSRTTSFVRHNEGDDTCC